MDSFDGPLAVDDLSHFSFSGKDDQAAFHHLSNGYHDLSRGISRSNISMDRSSSSPQALIERGEVKVQQPEDFGFYHYGTAAAAAAPGSGTRELSQHESMDLDPDDMFLEDSSYHRADTQETMNIESGEGSGDYLPPSLRMEDTKILNPPSSFYKFNTAASQSVEIRSTANGARDHSSFNHTSDPLLSLTSTSSVSASHMTNESQLVQTPPTTLSSSNSSSGAARLPFLYSAIGSLEKASANSFGRIQTQAFAARDFCGPSKHKELKLLPPQNGLVPTKPNTQSSIKKSPEKENQDSGTPNQSNATLPIEKTYTIALKTTPSSATAAVTTAPVKGAEEVGDQKSRRKSMDALHPSSNDSCRTTTTSNVKNRGRRKLKKVTIDPAAKAASRAASASLSSTNKKQPVVELFRPSSDAYTPRMSSKKHIPFKPAALRTPVQTMAEGMGSLSRPNFKDALRRVAMIIKQHVVKIEQRFENAGTSGVDGLFLSSMREAFSEDNFVTPKYKCTMVRLPMARPGLVYGLKKVTVKHTIPTEEEIYEFGHQLFQSVQLSSECSIVCLIYVERVMEVAMVPLVASTWRPIFMCGLLLASKVWQDLSSWNIEFASVYPQFSLDAINRLELLFLNQIKWDLYISSSLYAKYYFALRSILEKQDFRMRYNRMVGVAGTNVSDALKVQQRSEQIKEEVVTLHLSRSM